MRLAIVDEDECHVIWRHLFGVVAQAVREVQEALQVLELASVLQIGHVVEDGPEVRTPKAAHVEVREVVLELVGAGDLGVGLHARVALDDVDVHLAAKFLGLHEDVEGMLDEALAKVAAHGLGGIDGDDKVAHALRLLVLKRLDERHVSVKFQPIGVEDVVELVIVNAHVLGHRCEATQEVAVVIGLTVGDGQARD